ncbi:hypothetical protein HK102_008409 [Quaeritorhiza haematococci]|nr:hypothetical protein HK102_008409 [Quaeritorhiza haematococci]
MALKDALAVNKGLARLLLTNSNMRSEGAIALAESLPLAQQLERLDLTHNPLDIAGVMALSVSMRMNQSITELEIAPLLLRVGPDGVLLDEDPELARLLNDITIYCQRNSEIKKARLLNASAESPGSLSAGAQQEQPPRQPPSSLAPSSTAMQQPPQQQQQHHHHHHHHRHHRRASPAETKQSQNELASAAAETATVLDQMLGERQSTGARGLTRSNSQEDLIQQLYIESKEYQKRIQHAISENIAGADEELLARLLALNDQLEVTIQSYESQERAAGADDMEAQQVQVEEESSPPPPPPKPNTLLNQPSKSAPVAPLLELESASGVSDEQHRQARNIDPLSPPLLVEPPPLTPPRRSPSPLFAGTGSPSSNDADPMGPFVTAPVKGVDGHLKTPISSQQQQQHTHSQSNDNPLTSPEALSRSESDSDLSFASNLDELDAQLDRIIGPGARGPAGGFGGGSRSRMSSGGSWRVFGSNTGGGEWGTVAKGAGATGGAGAAGGKTGGELKAAVVDEGDEEADLSSMKTDELKLDADELVR